MTAAPDEQAIAQQIARPLVMKCGAFGDMVQLTALVRQLNARFGLPVDLISSGAWTRPLFQDQPGVGAIHVVRSRHIPFWLSVDQQRIARYLRARGAGPAWCCDGELSRRFLRRTGVPADHICDAESFPIRPGERMVERWIRFACATPPAFRVQIEDGKPVVPAASHIVVGRRQLADCDAWLQRRGLAGRSIVTIHAGNKRTMRWGPRRRRSNTKYWPEERWGAVLRAIRSHRPAHAIVLLGVRRECVLNDDIIRAANIADVHNAADELPLSRLLALLKRAESMISVDSGPAHAAAAVGCPVLVMFGTADPIVNQPTGPGSPVITLTGHVGGCASILGITVSNVVDAWLSLSREPGPQCVDLPTAPSFP